MKQKKRPQEITRQARLQRKNVESGKCARCSKTSPLGGWLCQACDQKKKESMKGIVEKRLASGLCRYCGKSPHEEGDTACLPCRLSLREKTRKRRQHGKR